MTVYEQYLWKHIGSCPINHHEGSAGSVEAAGLADCFMNSIENWKLRSHTIGTHYIGDGDSKAYI